MTDKKIIIDGIDVTGCEWISEVGLDSEYICNCNSPNKTSGYCKYNPNCCYKQLKRKEQECEELKAEIKLSKEMLIQNTSETNKYTIPQIIEQFISDNYIDQQNEDGYTIPIFLQLEDILYQKESLEEKLGLAETTKGLQRIEIEKIKQTLTEIKEIAEKEVNNRMLFADKESFCDFNKILQKISECEGNDE